MVVAPFLNVMVPVGIPLYCGTAVAVNVTDSATVEGFTDETSMVVVVDWFTNWCSGGEVLPAKVASPE